MTPYHKPVNTDVSASGFARLGAASYFQRHVPFARGGWLWQN